MSNLQDFPNCSKPIHRVEDVLLDMNKKLDNMKVDVGCIKSDLKIILKRIDDKQKQEDAILKNQVKKQEALSKGWFFTY
tara:strand:- start:563 stop:799 length:237 start_codon:yes stop_codon:yes gene_type:complete